MHSAEQNPEVEPGGRYMKEKVIPFAWTLGCVGKVGWEEPMKGPDLKADT